MQTIIRYSNRKMYCPKTSKYVNLSTLVDLIKNNEHFEVIDHSTKEDITNRTLKECVNLISVPNVILRTIVYEYQKTSQNSIQKSEQFTDKLSTN